METSEMTQCSKCGTPIKNIIMIDGKPYGTECATTILGINQLPSWFKGGDWNKAKLDYDANARKNEADFKERKNITRNHWEGFIRLSRALRSARIRDNQWEMNFIESISAQAGFYTLTNEGCEFNTMEEAEIGWKPSMGSFPYLVREIKGLSGLSSKQINLLEKIESK